MLQMNLQQVARALGGDVAGDQVLAPGPGHSPKDRSLSIKIDAAAPRGFLTYSHSGDDPLRCKDYVSEKLGLPPWRANSTAANSNGLGKIVATYDYTDETGEPLFQVTRYAPKEFRQRRPNGRGEWSWKLDGVRRVLYRLPEITEAIALGQTIFIAEGEKAVAALVAIGVQATCSPSGAGKWRDEYSQHLKGANVVILPDNDEPGDLHAKAVAKSLAGIASRVRALQLPGLPPKGDPYDWIESGATAERLWQLLDLPNKEDRPRLWPLDISELFGLKIPKREMILDPILPEKGLAMLYASRGIGKTLLACGISCAAAAGMPFLKWQAERPRRVLHCDGEMPASELRERFRQVIAGMHHEPGPGMLRILSADLVEDGIGNFASPKVQQELDPLLDGVELLVLDNLSSLTSVIRDNDAESWNPIQEWLLRLRRRGVSVLIVHHAGKGGEQRGTSRREDVLDTSLSLRRPSDYVATEGARFELHFEKARGIHGEKAKPFEAKFELRNDAAFWTIREIEDVNLARVKALLDDDLTLRDIADETGLSKSAVGRIKKKIEAEAADDNDVLAATKDTPWDKNL